MEVQLDRPRVRYRNRQKARKIDRDPDADFGIPQKLELFPIRVRNLTILPVKPYVLGSLLIL